MEDAISLPEAAVRLGKSWQATYNLALTSKLGPLRRFGRSYVLSADAVDAYLGRERQAGRVVDTAGTA